MKRFLNPLDGSIWDYDDNCPDSMIKDGLIQLSDDEIDNIINPSKEPEMKALEAAQARDDAMLQGFIYGTNTDGTDRYISVTKDDGDGMVQVKVSFELGLTSTVIHFANGSKLPMSAEEFPTFALQFVTERGKFFS